jgi:hypothetical protein
MKVLLSVGIPGVQRSADRAIHSTAPDVQTAHDVCRIALMLAATVVRRERL